MSVSEKFTKHLYEQQTDRQRSRRQTDRVAVAEPLRPLQRVSHCQRIAARTGECVSDGVLCACIG